MPVLKTDYIQGRNEDFILQKREFDLGWQHDLDDDGSLSSFYGSRFSGQTSFRIEQAIEEALNIASSMRPVLRIPKSVKVMVNIGEDSSRSYCSDEEKKIVLSPDVFGFSEYSMAQRVDVFIGLYLHESSHVLYTDFDTWRQHLKHKSVSRYVKLFKMIFNIIEDEMIERKLGIDFPGYVLYIAKMKRYVYDLLKITDKEFADLPKVVKMVNTLLYLIRFPDSISKIMKAECSDLIRSVSPLLINYPNKTVESAALAKDVFAFFLHELQKVEQEELENKKQQTIEKAIKEFRENFKQKQQEKSSSESNSDDTSSNENKDKQNSTDEGNSNEPQKDTSKSKKSVRQQIAEGVQKAAEDADKYFNYKRELEEIQDDNEALAEKFADNVLIETAPDAPVLDSSEERIKRKRTQSSEKLVESGLLSRWDMPVLNKQIEETLSTIYYSNERLVSDDGMVRFRKGNPKFYDKTLYGLMAKKISGSASTIRTLLKYSFRDEKPVHTNLKRGFLDTNKLVDAVCGEDKIYKRNGEIKSKYISVALVMDLSGSMENRDIKFQGDKITRVCAAQLTAIMFNEALKNVAVVKNLFIYGYNSALDTPTTKCYIFKEPRYDNTSSIPSLSTSDANRDGVAIYNIAKRIRTFTQDKVLMLVMNDGLPNAFLYDNAYAIEDTKEKVKAVEKMNFDVVQIALTSKVAKAHMFKHSLYFPDTTDLPKTITKYLKKRITSLTQYTSS